MSAKAPVKSDTNERSARERLLDAADELFYAEGVHVVGIDRVIERAGVAKATLYSAFGSKEELVRAYLRRRHERRQARFLAAIERHDEPREQILAVFDAMAEAMADPRYRGCAFVNAVAEGPTDGAAAEESAHARAWTRSLFLELVTAAGAREPDVVAGELMVLHDGAMATARMDGDPAAATRARSIAAAVLDAAGVR
jgi:AcrR family transcriptional regulator